MIKGQLAISRLTLSILVLWIFTVSSLIASNRLFEVISTGDDHTEIQFNLSDYTVEPVEIDGVTYNRLYHPDAGYLMDETLPEVIHFSFYLSVPRTGGVSIDQPVINGSKTLNDFMLFPSQGYDLDICEEKGFIIDSKFYDRDIDYPENLVQISTPTIMRDSRLVNVTLYPFSYNPARSELTVRENMTVRVNYNQSIRGEFELTRPERRPSRGFERVKRGLVLNHGQFRNPNLEYQPRSILIIRHHSNTINALVDQFAGWKRDKGFEVTVTTTQNMSTDGAIKNYITNAYNNWNIPPEYVILIGDGGGGVLTIPYNTVQNDHFYALLEGGNDLADVFVGRISVPNAEGLATIWNKVRNYERIPFMGDTAWYRRSTIIADLFSHNPQIPNASPLFMAKFIKEMKLTYNPDYNITEILQPPYPQQMTTAMNQGGLFFWYRGSIGGSGWVASEALTNGFRTPHANYVTCSTLDYNGGRQAEPIFRVGTPTTSRGAITVVGYRGGVNTGPGNALTAGTLKGIYVDGIRNMGEALVFSKMNLWRVYGNSHTSQALQHSRGGNLIGDPSMDIWLDVPKPLNADYPETVPVGSNSVVVTVTDADDNPVEGAWVTVRQLDDVGNETIFETGYTAADGISPRFFPADTEGELKVTVTKPEYIPHLGSFEITGAPAVSFHELVTNDDFDAGEQVNFVLVAANHRTQAVNGVNGTLSTTDEYINITNNTSAFGNIAAGGTAESAANFTVQISPETPANHKALMNLTMTDNAQNSWVSRFLITVRNGNLVIANLNIIDDGGNGVLDPLEEADLRYHIRNTGQFTIPNVRGQLLGDAYGVSIIDSSAVFGNIAPGQTVSSTDNHFRLSTSTYVIEGQVFTFDLLLYNDEGFSQKHQVDIEIGTVTVNTPLGPDEYGYWIYDDGDEGYVDSPEYDWIEIASGNGGFNGEDLEINADYDNIQGHRTIDLPFTFKFYGIDYDEVTVSANGWISFGVTEQSTQRNWRLPGVLGPSPMVAAFWDNLGLGQGSIYTYHYQERNKFIIQWENTTNVLGNAINTFQIILYDPSSYYTTTFDGPIKIQYKIFNNVNSGANSPGGIGNWGNYCTVGIRNHLNTVGLEYTYNNRYPTAAKRITNETALYITTGLSSALVGIQTYSFSDGNNNIPEYGEVVDMNMTLQNVGIEEAFDVTARLTTEDPYINILQDSADYGDLDIQESVNINNAFTFEIADDIPHLYRPTFKLSITAADNLFWSYDFSFPIHAPHLISQPPFIHDPEGNNNGLIDPGEQLIMYLPIRNLGATTPPVDISVTSESNLVTINSITDPQLHFITRGETQYAEVHLSVSEQAEVGSGLRFGYTFDSGNYTFEGQFLVGVGGIVPVRMGEGDTTPGNNAAGPINIYYRSNRSQFVYSVEEFNEHGIYGEFPINQMGFFIEGAPEHPLIDFKVRLGHTSVSNASEHYADSLLTGYRANYIPTAGDWDLLTFDTPFLWNGVDNLLVDTSFAPVAGWSSSGQIRVYEYESGYRFARADSPDQTNVVTNTVNNDKPQVMMMMGIDPEAAANRPRNLTAVSTAESINLNWQPPAGNRNEANNRRRGVAGREDSALRNTTYNVYRNGILLNEEPMTETEFIDTNVEGYTTYHYYATSIIDDVESNPSNIVSIEANAVAMPQITPEPGVYQEPITVVITCETDDSTIYYTTDDSDPSTDGILYEEAFDINYHTRVRAIAVREGWLDSREASSRYYILYSPQNVRGTGTTNSVMLLWEEPWSPERTAVNDNDSPELSDQKLESSFDISQRMPDGSRRRSLNSAQRSLQATRNVYGYNVYRSTDNEEFEKINDELLDDFQYTDTDLERNIYYYYVTAVYDLGESGMSPVAKIGVGIVTRPTFDPEPGEYQGYVELRLRNTAGPAAAIYYTLNGEDPDETSPHYTVGTRIMIETTTTVKAYAVRTDWEDSGMATGVFTIIETSVEDEEIVPIMTTELLPAYPNPFNPSTTIAFNLKESDDVTIEVYNILGKKVKTLVNERLQAGNHQIVWQGEDDNNRRVSSGIYFYRMQTSDYSSVKKIVMIK